MTLTNADLAERLGVIARNLSEHGRNFADELRADDLTAIHDTITTAAARLGVRRVVITPNTALAAHDALVLAAEAAEAVAQLDPRELMLPADLAAGLIARLGGATGDTWREIARRIESALDRDQIPDPHVSIASDTEPGDPDRVLRISLAVEITGDWVNPEVIAYTARTLAAQLSNSLRAEADDAEEYAADLAEHNQPAADYAAPMRQSWYRAPGEPEPGGMIP